MGEPGFYWYEGDYLRDTMHLSDLEDLAYRRLLGAYYSKGPFQNDIKKLCKSARLVKRIVLPVVEEFFPIQDDGLRHNKKADKVIAERKKYLEEQTRKAKLGAAARWEKNARGNIPGDNPENAPGHDPGITGALPGRCPSSSSSSSFPNPTPTTPLPPVGFSFTEFWNLYPRKSGRDAACRAWVSMVENGDAEAIRKALEWQLESEQWTKDEGKFVPSAEKYLFDRRWTDEPPAEAGPRVTKADKEAFYPKRKVVE